MRDKFFKTQRSHGNFMKNLENGRFLPFFGFVGWDEVVF